MKIEKKLIKQIKIDSTAFEFILKCKQQEKAIIKANYYEDERFKYGYKCKQGYILYDNDQYLVITEIDLYYILRKLNTFEKNDLIHAPTNYLDTYHIDTHRQICIRKDDELNDKYEFEPSGTQAYMLVFTKWLRKYYKAEEIESILNSHTFFTSEHDKHNQLHYQITDYMITNKCLVKDEPIYLDEVVKYDINKAYCSELCKLFPKAADYLKSKYETFDKAYIKKIFNFAIGMLVRREHRGTYNYIVNNIRNRIEDAIKTVDGELIYANTDGFIIHDPKNKLKYSKKIGDWDKEYEGDIFLFYTPGYAVYQTKDEIKGSLPKAMRKYFNLYENRYVHYRRKLDKETNTYEYIEIEELKYEK